ncbi:hypothetical protein HDV06_003904 [Boothiomyces sp. JEL0866]|nr:hypothetical protein HDV06_003904 [Boothiomyces sp. JEL0866]
MSEIDDIFGKKNRKEIIEKKESIPVKQESKVKKKKKEKEFKIPQPRAKSKLETVGKVETVEFSTKAEPKKPKIVDPEDDGTFADSRGSKPRKQTEDGLPIYLDTELNVGLDGGDTPQCPFDCQCCF